MSTASAIAAITATLHRLIEDGIQHDGTPLPDIVQPQSEIRCTTLPLDQANEENRDRNRINLFLYRTEVNAALSNMDIPHLKGSNRPPLALNLFYLLTAYGEDHNKFVDHLLLGRAMRVMYDLPQLKLADLRNTLAASGLHEQYERVHITPQPMSVDEISKIWSAFQTQYRVSAAYQVSVILIDSQQAGLSPLPVLKRGSEDRGAVVLPAHSPLLQAITMPNQKPSAELGDILMIHGERLDGEALTVRFRHLRSGEIIEETTPEPDGTATQLQVKLPSGGQIPGQWPAGMFGLSLIVQRPNLPAWTTNEIPFALASQMKIAQPVNGVAPPGSIGVTLTCIPQIRANQQAVLLFGDRQVKLHSITTPPDLAQPTTLFARVDNVPAGEYILRLRVDGVESLPFKWTAAHGFEFDPAQKITVR